MKMDSKIDGYLDQHRLLYLLLPHVSGEKKPSHYVSGLSHCATLSLHVWYISS
jgi:hypothetical protein